MKQKYKEEKLVEKEWKKKIRTPQEDQGKLLCRFKQVEVIVGINDG